MAMLFANAPRMFVIKAKRDTVVLLLAAMATTFALAQGRRSAEPATPVASAAQVLSAPQPEKGWTGNLAAAPQSDAVPGEVLSSASLVVPKAQLTLPALPAKPTVHAKAACDSLDKNSADKNGADRNCVIRSAMIAVPQRRQVAALDLKDHDVRALDPHFTDSVPPGSGHLIPPEPIPTPGERHLDHGAAARKSFLASFNPLDHVPDLKTIGRPFAAAGSTVGGWIRGL